MHNRKIVALALFVFSFSLSFAQNGTRPAPQRTTHASTDNISSPAQDSLAVDSLEKIFRAHPESKRAHLGDYIYALSSWKGRKAAAKVINELDGLARQKDLSADELLLLYNFYGLYDQPSKGAKYAGILQGQYPGGTYALLKYKTDALDQENFGRKLQFYKGLQSQQDVYLQYHSVIDNYLRQDDFAHIHELLSGRPKEVWSRTWFVVATLMVQKDQDLDLALKYAGWGYESAKEGYEHPRTALDSNYAKFNMGKCDETIGYILAKQGKYAEALAHFDEGKKYAPRSPFLDLEELYLLTLAHSDRYAEARPRLEERLRKAEGSPVVKEALKVMYLKGSGHQESGFEAYFGTLKAAASDSLRVQVKASMIATPAIDFSLEDLDGNRITLAALKGKVVVMDFWATWCGPCIASFPGMTEAAEKYKNDKDVVFLFVNAWESGNDAKSKVMNFAKSKKLPFQVWMDDKDKVITAYGVKGIPTKFIIDKEGNIRFSKEGNPAGQEELVTELSTMIELAKKG